MTNSQSWTCDGIPKDGQEYPDSLGEHEPHENFGPDCEICGLPKEALQQQGSKGKGLPKKTLLTGATALIAVVAVGAGGFYLWNTAQGCGPKEKKVNGTCVAVEPKPNPNHKKYEQAVQTIETALPKTKKYESLKTLKTAHKNIQKGLIQLNKIPKDADIYSKAQTKLKNYQPKVTEVEQKIQKEQKATKKLASAKKIAMQAKEKTPSSTSQDLSQLKEAKQAWNKALNTLEEAPENTLVNSQIQAKVNNYQAQVDQVTNRIQNIARAIKKRKQKGDGEGQGSIEDGEIGEQNTRNCQQKPKPEQCLW